MSARHLSRTISPLRAPYRDAGWGPAFDRLAELVQKHVAREESDYFPQAQKAMGDDLPKQLLPLFESAKKT